MGYLYFDKGQSFKVSEHFDSTEFDCHGSGCCSRTVINEKLIEYLEQIRNHFNVPITITSPYRCPTHNSRIGGAAGSRHSKGDASDIVVKGVAPRTVAQFAESIGILGIGLYETSNDGHFVHIDTRDYKSFWYGQNEQPRTTFGSYSGASNSIVTPSNSTSGINTILNFGDRGGDVAALQSMLIKLGYSCGSFGADGDFGTETKKAVMNFQRDTGIGVDGIAGHQTLTAIADALKNKNKNSDNCKFVRITANVLNVRSGAGTNHKIVSTVLKNSVKTVIEEKDGWGRISDPAGWISGQYYEDV
jgi:hypothetical protein